MNNNHVVLSTNTCWYACNFRLPLIRALIDEGWRVTVLAPRDSWTARLAEAGAAHRHIEMDQKGTNPLRELSTLQSYKSAYRELSPAVALQYTIKPDIYGSIAARRLGVPVVNTITGLGTMFSGGMKEAAFRALYRYAFARSELTIFQNGDDRALFLKHRIVPESRAVVLPGSGVDTERFTPRPRGNGPVTFLFVGRLLRAKGAEDFIGAARIIKSETPDARFVLLGAHDPSDPDYARASVLAQAREDGTVEHHDHVDDVRPFLGAADCVVLPSYYREGVPRSLLEAASMGKPLIAADSIGTREPVIDGRNGLLCRPRDIEDLADKMRFMVRASAGERDAMGSASRAYMVERFDERAVIAAYRDAVRRLAGGSEPAS